MNIGLLHRFFVPRQSPGNFGLLLAVLGTLLPGLLPAQSVFIPAGATWKYLDTGADLGTAWVSAGFDDTAWSSGVAPLGYGDPVTTTISFGADANNKHVTSYFRRKFTVADPSAFGSLILRLRRDDGAVVYLNGTEVARSNMPEGPVNFRTLAPVAVGGTDETTFFPFDVPVSALVAGENLLAVELHQANITSSDLEIDVELLGNRGPTVSIASPADGSTLNGPLDVVVDATASDIDGTISLVEFHDGGVKLGERTAAPFSLTVTNLGDGDYRFTAVATDNSGARGTSAVSRVTVNDPNPPAVTRVVATTNQVFVTFTKRVGQPSATTIGHYSISNNATVLAAGYGARSNQIVLDTTVLERQRTYHLFVGAVQDYLGQPVPPGTAVPFQVTDFLLQDVGAPTIPTVVTRVPGGYDLTVAGTGFGGNTDQFAFNYAPQEGNFDLKTRIAALDVADPWSRAGLMARQSLANNAPFVAVWATPSVAGCFLQARVAAGAALTSLGSAPVNHPYTWLRLRRTGSLLSGYASADGANWTPLGSVTVTLTDPIFVGLAASSQNGTTTTTARFRDVTDATGTPLGAPQTPPEPPGPSSRKTGLAITEIMYDPAPRADARELEFVEIYNSNPFFEDISGFRFTGEFDFTFPPGTRLAGGAYAVIAKSPADFAAVYGPGRVFGPFTNSLSNGGGRIRLRNPQGVLYLEVPYSSHAPWPVAAAGAGHSLVLNRPSYGEADPQAWAASDLKGGSPGAPNGRGSDPLGAIVINEFRAGASHDSDFIELYNRGSQPADLSGAWLSDSPTTNKVRIPDGTILPPGGLRSFNRADLGFSLDPEGDRLFLSNPAQTRVIDAVEFESQAAGFSSGRQPDGAGFIGALATATPGTANSGPRASDLVVNEIMYKPLSDDTADEYVELYNRSAAPLAVGGWKLKGGIEFSFPSNTVIAAGGYAVVAKNRTNLLARHPALNAAITHGNYSGTLRNSGDRIALASEEILVTINDQGVTTTNVIHPVLTEVNYRSGGRWGNWANLGGSSLELVDARSNARLAPNWGDSDETAKAPWTVIEATGPMELGAATASHVEIILNGEGECLIDDVEVSTAANPAVNLVPNPKFENGATSWLFRGNHVRSSVESGTGFGGSQCLHARASARGDYGANRILAALTAVPSGTVTIRARVRWLRGFPELIIRLHGAWMEATGPMLLPTHLGTPGQPNSIRAANAGPAITDVTHNPVLPPAGQPVVVTARIEDPDGLGALSLNYRIDPAATFTSVALKDDGTGGDALAGDGIFSATIPGQAAGTMVPFYLQAADAAGTAATSRFPASAPARECLVRFGDPDGPSSYGTYRMWLSQKSVAAWIGQPILSNERIDATFVYGASRVIYNIAGKYSGSPYHQSFQSPVDNQCHYSLEIPGDDLLLGTDNFNKIHAPGNGPWDDNTLQREQTCYWMARQLGLPWNYRRSINMIVNGNRRQPSALMEDSQTPGADVVEQQFPDDDEGDLFKLQPWFEMDDAASGSMGFANVSWCTLNRYQTTVNGVPSQPAVRRYRWNYLARARENTANNYDAVLELIQAANTPVNGSDASGLIKAMESVADMEEWFRIFAIEHASGNWDSFGYQNAQNMYGYKPQNGKWTLFIWDWNIVLGNSGSHGPDGGNLFNNTHSGQDTVMPRLYSVPHFRRMYLRAFQDIINGPMNPANVNPMIDAKYNAMVASGFAGGAANPQPVKDWIATMRNSLQAALVTEGATNQVFGMLATNQFTSSSNVIVLNGRAPLAVKTILVNGLEYPVTWVNNSSWSVRLAVAPGNNEVVITGLDRFGQSVPGASVTNLIHYSGQPVDPTGTVIFNEVMFAPAVPGTGFVEIHNRSTNTAFDISGWRVQGIDYTFPPGTFLSPQAFLVLVENRTAFSTAYPGVFYFDQYDGRLDRDGEMLALIKPGANPAQDVVIDRFRFESALPWPQAASTNGASLQLVDPRQDNRRVANWKDAPEWRFVSKTGEMRATARVLIYLNAPGDTYLDDLSLVIGSVPESGTNFIRGGTFESADVLSLRHTNNQFYVATNYRAGTAISQARKHAGASSLYLRTTNYLGAGTNAVVYQNFSTFPTNRQLSTLSYWYRFGGTNTLNVLIQGAPQLNTAVSTVPVLATPGTNNTSVAATLEPFPTIWINEVAPGAAGGFVDDAGDAEPWIELFNAGDSPVSLDGLYLADQFGDLTQWPLPAGITLAPNEFKIIVADGQAAQGSPAQPHAPFRLSALGGRLALSRVSQGEVQVLDYVNYPLLRAGNTFGSVPDGDPYERLELHHPTPGAANDGTYPTVTLFINEWMAVNNSTIADPVDGAFNDWFELYNPGDSAIAVGGFYLTDTALNPRLYRIPAGFSVPARGHLLVWADGSPGKNTNAFGQLHVNFKLSAAGEYIGLFAPDGRLVDAVTYEAQSADASQGRQPDGAALIGSLPTPTPGAGNPAPPPPGIVITVTRDGTQLKLAWPTQAGRRYQLEAAEHLAPDAWAPLGDVRTAAGSVLEAADEPGLGLRFYRVRLLP